MARLLTCGFETGSLLEMNGGSFAALITGMVKRTGDYCCQLSSHPVGQRISDVFVSDETTIFVRVAIQIPSTVIPVSDGALVEFRDSAGDIVGQLCYVAATQTLKAVRGDYAHSFAVLAVGYATLSQSVWYVLEIKYTPSATVGEFIWKINGVTDGSFSGSTTAGLESVRSIFFIGPSSYTMQPVFDIDDVAVNNVLGGVQDSWIGLGGCIMLRPASDGDLSEWIPSAGTTHWNLVDDKPYSILDWIESGTPSWDLFHFEATPDRTADIALVQMIYYAAVNESGYQEIKDVLRQNAVDYEGTAQTVVAVVPGYQVYRGSIFYEQPNGSGDWTKETLDIIQAGLLIPV